jgi:hypothetical protein
MQNPADFQTPCARCGNRSHVLDLLYHGLDGPFCFECYEANRSAQLAKLKSSSIRALPQPPLNLLLTALAVGIAGLIAAVAIPTFLRLSGSSDAQEFRTLFVGYHNTEIGQAARQVIERGSLRADQTSGARVQPLLDKRQLEALLLPGGVLGSAPVRPPGTLAEAIQEAAELARVRRDQAPEFAAEVAKAWEQGDYEVNVGALIKVIQTWRTRNGEG